MNSRPDGDRRPSFRPPFRGPRDGSAPGQGGPRPFQSRGPAGPRDNFGPPRDGPGPGARPYRAQPPRDNFGAAQGAPRPYGGPSQGAPRPYGGPSQGAPRPYGAPPQRDSFGGPPREVKERLTFRPDGSSDTQWREQRGPRPGRQERDAIKRGERPFWRGQSEAGPAAGPQGGSYDAPPAAPQGRYPRPARPDFGNRPPPPARRDDGGYRQEAPRPWEQRPARPSRPPQDEGFAPEGIAPEPRPPSKFSAPPSGPRPFYDRFAQSRPVRAKGAPKAPRAQPAESAADDEDDDLIADEAPVAPKAPKASARPAKKVSRDNRIPRSAKSTYQGPAPTETQKTVPELVARIIGKAGSEVAADLALRQELKRRRTISPEAAAQVSRAVFRHYRWLGWLNKEAEPELQMAQANALEEAFRARPGEITDAELRAKAVPAWTWDVLSADAQWLRALQTEPQLWLRARPGHRDALAAKLNVTRPGPLPDSLAYDGGENLFKNRAFQAGEFEIQDLGSQVVGLLCAPEPGQFWWDACAGEGGKTLHLADLMQGKGLVYASDRAEWRLERLRMRASRAQCFNFRAVTWQGGPKPPTKTAFDGVLVDAPCSGLGTWSRNPHARWTTTPKDVTELAVLQRSLLENVAPSLKPGGRLFYAVCTLTRAETTEVADAFTAQHPEFEPLPLANPFAPDSAPSAQLAFWPQQTAGNGMFVAAWRKKDAVPTSPSA